ncbi:MAG: DJ-1/PfpI family protein [Chlorobi bacterium]|nr:DJ-1/PfpI family protein [Chlorobiota bacterium]
MKRVYVFFAEGFEEIEAITPVDVLRRAGIDVTTVSVTDRKEVTGSHSITVVTDALIADVKDVPADMLVLPGGMPGAVNLNNNTELKEMIKEYSDRGKQLGAICAAPLVFGEMGLLENKTATCYPGFENHLKGASISANAVETSSNVITGKGVGAAMKFALELVAQLTDKKTADDLAAKMVVE